MPRLNINRNFDNSIKRRELSPATRKAIYIVANFGHSIAKIIAKIKLLRLTIIYTLRKRKEYNNYKL